MALREERGGVSLYHAGRSQPLALKGVTESEYAIRFTSGGKSLLAAEPTGRELVLTLTSLPRLLVRGKTLAEVTWRALDRRFILSVNGWLR